ncbi:hypothetical protein NQ318_013535 [Aromia moschata]|uniref:Coiled-coil domain-containing protein n=1 Tax=Aromia moschata TaxID=1265417 RepID=A0AAV8XZ35_9CUCU|nr:hypothetical protein NQ318_013535 [Aromia moschata]
MFPLVENVNRLQIDGEEARTVEEAIRVLNIDSVDLIPEKSMKAAYTAYEKRRLQELKLEYPTLRLFPTQTTDIYRMAKITRKSNEPEILMKIAVHIKSYSTFCDL